MKIKFLPTPDTWRRQILQLGMTSCVLATTLISVFFSMVVTIALANLLHATLDLVGLVTAIVVPAVLGSFFGYYLFQQYFQLEKFQSTKDQQKILDELTGAHTREDFLELAGREFDRAFRGAIPLSLIYLDVDDFHLINDQYGHACGDEVLRCISTICRESLRRHDLFGRYDGEEFVILLSGTGGRGLMRATERIRQVIHEQPVEWDGQKVPVTVSAGMTTLKDDDPSFDAFLQRAGLALTQAKEAGKDCQVAI